MLIRIELYKPENTDYEHNGDMPLLPESASVKAILNGSWKAEIQHPIDEEGRWKWIEEDAVVKLESFNGTQLFRIKKKAKSDAGVSAEWNRFLWMRLMIVFCWIYVQRKKRAAGTGHHDRTK